MITERDFQAALDADPSQCELRCVFADWLAECGDPRAAGYRWLGENRKWPTTWTEWSERADWNIANAHIEEGRNAELSNDIFSLLPKSCYTTFRTFTSRFAAEEALVAVILQMEGAAA